MMPPTWESDCGTVKLWRGDCLEILPTLGKVDAVITDPPYGIGFKYESHDDSLELWCGLMDKAVPLCKAIAPFVIMPSCQIKRLEWWYTNHQPEWLVAWHKGSPGHCAAIGFNDWEPHVCWGRPKRPMHDYFSTVCGFDVNGHPCPKPITYSIWLVERGAVQGDVVCDPFMGSGTTGVAAVRLGRSFWGIEIDETYFEIAKQRIINEMKLVKMSFGLTGNKPKQANPTTFGLAPKKKRKNADA